MAIVRKVSPRREPERKRNTKRVAAYARVSSDFEDQVSSFENQVEIYTRQIMNNPDWEFVDVYADNAMTGTNDDRPGFQRLIADCEAGKIDLILCKSISRFARNTLITVETVRKLNALRVFIIFEKENIDTSQPYSEMLLTILAAFAQEESRETSERVKKSLHMRSLNGEVNWTPMFGYIKVGDKPFVIVEDEAEVVCFIFDAYLKYHDIYKVKDRLWEKYHLHKNYHTLRGMLMNVKYAGDVLTHQTYVSDHLSHRLVKNRGECEQVYIEDHHDAIVDRLTFRRVQESMQRKSRGGKNNQYPFGSMVKCPYCGKSMRQRKRLYWKTGSAWVCEDIEECHKYAVRSDDIEKAVLDAYNQTDKPLGEIDEIGRWWIDELVDSLKIEDKGNTSFVTVFWKNSESTRTEIPIGTYTASYILKMEQWYLDKHNLGWEQCL